MSEAVEQQPKPNLAERGSRFLRNINILGAVALTGAAAVFPEFSVPLLTLAAVDIVQAVFFHATGRLARKRQPQPA